MKHFLFKKVPKNELGIGTEIAILKKYFDDKLIVDPKDIRTNRGTRSYSVTVIYNDIKYKREIKAYETQDYTKDRRLILKSSDTIWQDRHQDDYLVFYFENSISENSEFTIFILKPENPLFKKIDNKYKPSIGLVLNEGDILYNHILSSLTNMNTLEDQKSAYIINHRSKHPLNQILFGPPGTGKTDATVEKALEILDLKTDDRAENREIFRSLQNKNIFFVTMHPSYSYEDFVQGIKPYIQTKHKVYSNIFIVSHIQDDAANDAVDNYKEDIQNEYIYDSLVRNNNLITNDNLLIIRDRKNLIGYAEVSSVVSEPSIKKLVKCPNCGKADLRKRTSKTPKYICVDCKNEFETPKIEEKEVIKYTARFKEAMTSLQLPKETINQDIINYNPQVSIQQVKETALDKIMNSRGEVGTLLFKIQDGAFLRISKIARFNNDQKFVLILDEINRANISKIFGELITLLEEDKRIGKENELCVTLPSGEIFSVPPNLYIIGTMNTADKSIALVDIALRRRFQFVPIYPDSSVIQNYCKSDDKADKASFMDSLNTRLREDKGVDFQIGHAYFLKDNSLADIINENIIPLLVEYLRNDLEKVKKLLSDLGKPIDEDYYIKTGLLKYFG